MTSTLPQHHLISVSSFLTPNAVTPHHALSPSLRSTYASKYVNWLNITTLIVLHRITRATAKWQQRHLLRRKMYRLSTAVTEVTVITRVLQSSYWTGDSWMTAKMGFASEGGEVGTTASFQNDSRPITCNSVIHRSNISSSKEYFLLFHNSITTQIDAAFLSTWYR